VRIGLFVLFALFLAAPLAAGPYLLSLLTVLLTFAYLGQAWNIMMGFAGQLSLGHALYVGLGAYVSAALSIFWGIPPILGLFPAMAAAAAVGAAIGYLGFRFAVKGVHFTLLTIAFAEIARITFQHLSALGGTGGLFIPVGQRSGVDLIHLRGDPLMFYYLILAMSVALFFGCKALLASPLGYRWQALREDPAAAESLGVPLLRVRLAAISLSAALSAAGGVFAAFFYNALFPDQWFGLGYSIEIILAPIIGGLGTLFGPILGALLLTPLGEAISAVTEAIGWQTAGIKPFCYGIVLLAIVKFLPDGIWPAIRKRFP
jgi:branched-chain amino acid transport system permease protein